MKNKSFKNRYLLLDEIRGFAVICMVFFHAFYTCFDVFGLDFTGKLITFFSPAEPFFAAGFVFISGMCGMFSKNPWKRTVILMGVACGLSAVTFFITKNFEFNCFVVFGIIHLLAISWLLLSALKPVLLKIAPLLGLIINTLLAAAFFNVEHGYIGFAGLKYALPQSLYSGNFLWILGFPSKSFASADYFPVLPWVFIFFAGFFFCRMFKNGLPGIFRKDPIPPFSFVGRHALIIYIAHQPIIYLLGELINAVF